MKLARLESENFQKLTVIDITFGDHVTEISGPNGSGKSSTIDSIYCSLKGLDVAPEDPIRHGADVCAIRSHLKGDDGSVLLVTRRFRKDANGETVSDLALETPDGARFRSPATHLKQIISDHLLDPLEFLELDNEKQLNVLRSFAPGFDFDANKRQYDGLFAKRTEVNRDKKREQAAADSIDVLPTAPGERQDEAALTAELESAGAKNVDIERRRSNREKAVNRIADLRAACEKRATDSDRLVEALNRQIEELRAQIAEEQRALQADATRMTTEAADLQAKLDGAEPLPELVDAAVITAKLNEARRVNRLIEDWETQRARKAAHQREADTYSTQWDELTAKLADLEQARRDAIQKAHLPVDGLGFGDGFITYKGVRFDQVSTAERLRIAFALSVAKHPKLRLCWIRDASLLDDNSLQIVESLAREFDTQVLLETVRPNSGNAIVLEDGHVKGMEVEPKLTAVSKPAAHAANESAEPTDAPAPKSPRKRWQGPGTPTGDAT